MSAEQGEIEGIPRRRWPQLIGRPRRKVRSHTIGVYLCLERHLRPLQFAHLLDEQANLHIAGDGWRVMGGGVAGWLGGGENGLPATLPP